MRIRLKTYQNKKNGQLTFCWPKKISDVQPKELQLEIDKKLARKGLFGGRIIWK